jgi:hypothetical protein
VPVIALALLGALAVLTGGGAAVVSAQEERLPLGGTAATTAPTVMLESPEAGARRVITLTLNAQATVLGGPFNDGWYWLDFRGTTGYAQRQTLTLVDDDYRPVPLETPTPTRTPTPKPTATPQNKLANLWIGQMKARGAVRSGPGTDKSLVKNWWAGRKLMLYETAPDKKGELWYRVSDPPEAPMWVHSSLVKKLEAVKYETARFKGKWVNVNLSEQVVTAYVDGVPVKVTLASTGKASTPTNLGVQKVSWRLTSKRMRGGTPGIDYYDLPNVPYPQFFNDTGEALHGTYWHDNFGYPLSHGCVNLSTPMSKWFYEWGYVGLTVWVHR